MSSQKPVHSVHPHHPALLNAEAFQRLYESHHLAVFRFIYGLHSGPIEDVEDLTTTTFLRAWKYRCNFQGDQNTALGWLLKIARNLVIDMHRQNRRRGPQLDIDNQAIPSSERLPEDQVSHGENIQMLQRLLARLPDHHREILVLRYFLDWRVKEIAGYLEMSENTVSVTIRRLLKRLQDAWPES
jgi:RNA polymerase sigma-70 factor (ECF subfamily)